MPKKNLLDLVNQEYHRLGLRREGGDYWVWDARSQDEKDDRIIGPFGREDAITMAKNLNQSCLPLILRQVGTVSTGPFYVLDNMGRTKPGE
jgi:hypothetical protein